MEDKKERSELECYIRNILEDVRGDNEFPENQVLYANGSLLLTRFNKELLNQKMDLIGLFHNTLKEIYGKDLADQLMKMVNEKFRTLRGY